MPFAFIMLDDGEQIEGFPLAYSIIEIENEQDLPNGATYYETLEEVSSAVEAADQNWVDNINEYTDAQIEAQEQENAEFDAPIRESDLEELLSRLKIPDAQPEKENLWLNEGVLTFWNGEQNKIVDFNEGTNTSVFGTIVGDI